MDLNSWTSARLPILRRPGATAERTSWFRRTKQLGVRIPPEDDLRAARPRANLRTAPRAPGVRAIRIACHGKTDVGRRRELNEDSFHCSDRDGLAIVCDGMGGRDFGEVASSLAVSTLTRVLRKSFPRTLRGRRLEGGGPVVDAFVQLFDGWIRDVNSQIHSFGAVDAKYREMGTTLALVYHQEDLVVVAHVGDSRVYRIRDGGIESLTEDHSFVNAQVKAGLITREEAEKSAHKHIVTRAMGPRGVVKPDVAVLRARPGDLFVLCSDGLSDVAQAQDILETVQAAEGDLTRGVQGLIDLANARGGPDNVTVILTRLEE